ncbi:MAG TPA: PAS domain S-box protein, partial [Draconibacterium sp.]|nr:PAS domain S-box protein [Draconibacterium sp.]
MIYGITNGRIPLAEVQKIPLFQYRKKLDSALLGLIKEGKPYDVKFEIKRPDNGEIRWIHSIAEYRSDKKMVFGVLHDITDTYVARKALEESEKKFKLLFQNMNSAFTYHQIITDEEGKPVDYIFLDVNSKFEELTGLKRENIINKGIFEVFPEIEESWIKQFGKVALTGESINFSDYLGELDKHFQISAYSPRKGFFAITLLDISNRIKTEKELNEALIDLNLAQQISKIGNWKYDPEYRKILWSEQLYDIFERGRNLVPLNLAELKKYFDKRSFSQYENAINKAIKEGVSFKLQMELLLPERDSKWIKVICKPDKESGLSGHFLRGTIQDITNAKKAEVELHQSGKLLRTIIENIPDAIYMKDKNFRKKVANIGDARNCGLTSVEELIGKTDHDLFPKEMADVYLEDDKQVIERGEPVINREEIIPGEKGGKRWLLTTKIPLRNKENEIIGLVGIGRDITELKQKEQRLQLLQQTIEQSPLSVLITNPKGEIEYVNSAFTEVTGYSSQEAIGQNPGVLLDSDENDETYLKKFGESIHSGNRWNGEISSKKKDGTLFWNNVVLAPIIDGSHNIQHFVAITEDVSEKKNMVKELQFAKEKAEESDRLKSLFLANMSHEIRTPLNGILGFSNIICSGTAENKDLEMYGKIIENSGRRLLTVIDDIIDISKIQANQLKLYYGKFNINELIQELYIFYRTQNAEQLVNVELKFQLCQNENHSWAYSDKNRVYQVLRNLIDNAFKFTHSGSIEFGCSQSTDNELTLFVKDTGIGIEPDKQEIVFQSFRQAQEGKSRKYDGSGLGLSIVTGILERLKGKIWLDSKLGDGSVFYVSLPRNKEKIETDTVLEKSVTLKESNSKISKPRIVSVEDDKASVEYLKVVIKSLGYELVNFNNARAGIDYLKNNKADLVLMDVQLPEMNGFEATRIIKAEFPNLPVIIQTAYAMKTDMEKAFQAGCDDYLSKPLSLSILKEKIKKYVEN